MRIAIVALTTSQKEYIVSMDGKAKEVLKHGGQEALLMSLTNNIFEIQAIMDSTSHDELNYYCRQYDGFYMYMKLLENIAQGCADGIFDDIVDSPQKSGERNENN